jgi:hypothetical protein
MGIIPDRRSALSEIPSFKIRTAGLSPAVPFHVGTLNQIYRSRLPLWFSL